MDHTNVALGEVAPLHSPAANIFLNTSCKRSNVSPKGTVIHLNENPSPEVGVHINTTFAVTSSKKIQILLVVIFGMSVSCLIISGWVAFYCWNELNTVRRQLDTLKEERTQPAQMLPVPQYNMRSYMNPVNNLDHIPQLPEQKNPSNVVESAKAPSVAQHNKSEPINGLNLPTKDLVIVQFNGAVKEIDLGYKQIIGPWVTDTTVSSKNSEDTMELFTNYVKIKKTGVYLIYSQVIYLSQQPNCYFIFARTPGDDPRLLTSCATADDTSGRSLEKSQLSCSAQTVARLYEGDTVNLAQRENNRTLWLRPGYSYFGFVKLST